MAVDRAGSELLAWAARWRVVIEDAIAGRESLLAFGERDGERVVLKVTTRRAEAPSVSEGEVLRALEGPAVVRVLEYSDDAVLMERVSPGDSLADVALRGADDEATHVLADVIGRLASRHTPASCPTVRDWGQSFARYVEAGAEQLPEQLVESARNSYAQLAQSETATRLLHGDLHHYNVLRDARRGWVIIDPKGVVGELEFEIGAALRNPIERRELFLDPTTIQRRLTIFSSELAIDINRSLKWAFAQSVLSAVWSIEDGLTNDISQMLRLAEILGAMTH